MEASEFQDLVEAIDLEALEAIAAEIDVDFKHTARAHSLRSIAKHIREVIEPQWDGCEDCMQSGGQRDEYGEGNCSSCGGRGRRPANAAAERVVRQEEANRRTAAERFARRSVDDYTSDDFDEEEDEDMHHEMRLNYEDEVDRENGVLK